jgi:hypothetical protein
MEGEPSILHGITWALRFASDIAFRWIPGTVEVVAGTAPQVGGPIYTPITRPLSVSDVNDFLQTASAPSAYDHFLHDWSVLVAAAVLISLLCIASIIYCVVRILQVREHEHERFRAAGETVRAKDVSKTQLRWARILEEIHSSDEQKWRLAILEADIMLNELLDVLGYRGDTMGDKMKQATRQNFNTIDFAWEAHRARNEVAHVGSIKQLSEREARRVIGLYEQVFREFRFIE